MTWTTLTMKVTTPLFNGGADPDGTLGFRPGDDAGLRPASLRGPMRFWFRALAGAYIGSDLDLLGALERRVFGGIGQRDTGIPSPVMLRLPEPPRLLTTRAPEFLTDRRNGRWIAYLLGLGLMEMEGSKPRLTRPFVSPETAPFELKIRFRHHRRAAPDVANAVESLAYASLWLACTYGGLGARTRRGLGGVRITDVSGDLPAPWTPRALHTPGLELYDKAQWVWPRVIQLFGRHLRDLAKAEGRELGSPDRWAELPSFPVLSQRHSPAVLVPGDPGGWQEILALGGRQLRLFRANRPADIDDRRQGRVHTAEWDDVVNDDFLDFKLGALGLPVGFHDKKTDQTHTVNAVDARGEQLRRASPLWLRPVGTGDQQRLFTFALRSRFLPDGDAARVRLLRDETVARPDADDNEVFVEDDYVRDLTDQWMDTMRSHNKSFVSVIRE